MKQSYFSVLTLLLCMFCAILFISCDDTASSEEKLTYKMSGTITNSDGGGIPDIKITLKGGKYNITKYNYTDSDGAYTFSDLDKGDYKLTYDTTGYALSQTTKQCTITHNDIDLGTITANLLHGISGFILDAGENGVEGVEVTLSGDAADSQTTNSYGAYSFPGLAAGDYTLTPSKDGLAFSPESSSVTLKDGESATETFAAAKTHYAVSGHVIDEHNEGVFGLDVDISFDGNEYAVTTNESGEYSFLGENGGTYILSFERAAAEFTPASLEATVAGNDVVLEDVIMTDNSDAPHILPMGVTLVTIPGTAEAYVMDPPDSTYFVTLSSFSISETEITNAQFAQYLNDAVSTGDIAIEYDDNYDIWYDSHIDLYAKSGEDNQCWIALDKDTGTFYAESGYEDLPVVAVNWKGAKSFAEYYGLDLPTEAEWLYAASGGNNYEYGTADGTISSSNANYGSNIDHPVDVGSYPANPFGLYDMCGNVAEWVLDWMGEYPEGTYHNPEGPANATNRRVAGGSWNSRAKYCIITFRGSIAPNTQGIFTGFRVVSR